MHRTLSIALAFSFVSGTLVGCGGASSDNASASAAGPSNAATKKDPVAQAVVHEFLEAVRVGDVKRSSGLLTPLALQRTNEHDLTVAPLGSATASFQIGKTELIESDKALVESVWTDVDVEGKPINEDLVWALRKVDQGWRISGLAIQVDGEEPQLIDFENPTEVIPNNTAAQNPKNQPGAGGDSPPLQTAQDPFQQSSPR